MFTRRWLSLFTGHGAWYWPALIVVCVTSPAWAGLAPHLDTIGYDEASADARFSSLLTDGGSGQGIAVFDTGIDADHAMFNSRTVTGSDFTGETLSGEPDWYDGQGHGTGVASIAAGNQFTDSSSSTELGGVARGVDIVSVRVLDSSGSGSFSEIINGMDYVIDQIENHGSNIEAINMSLGTTGTFVTSPTGPTVTKFNNRADKLATLGVPILAASGNSGDQTGLSFPAISDRVLAVGSSDGNGNVSSFTNRNNELDLLTPGENIWRALQSDSSNSSVTNAGKGTSLAAPQATAAVLLIDKLFKQQTGREPTADELEDLVTASNTTIIDNGDEFPRLDLPAALDATYNIPEPTSAVLLALGSTLLMRRSHRRAFAN